MDRGNKEPNPVGLGRHGIDELHDPSLAHSLIAPEGSEILCDKDNLFALVWATSAIIESMVRDRCFPRS